MATTADAWANKKRTYGEEPSVSPRNLNRLGGLASAGFLQNKRPAPENNRGRAGGCWRFTFEEQPIPRKDEPRGMLPPHERL